MPATVSGAAGGGLSDESPVQEVSSTASQIMPTTKPIIAPSFLPLLFHVINFSWLIIPHGSTGDLSVAR
jgi:hypothetical protein